MLLPKKIIIFTSLIHIFYAMVVLLFFFIISGTTKTMHTIYRENYGPNCASDPVAQNQKWRNDVFFRIYWNFISLTRGQRRGNIEYQLQQQQQYWRCCFVCGTVNVWSAMHVTQLVGQLSGSSSIKYTVFSTDDIIHLLFSQLIGSDRNTHRTV